MQRTKHCICLAIMIVTACNTPKSEKEESKSVRLVTLDPGHFHAALVQKTMYPDVDSSVTVYAPVGPDLDLHLGRIESYNTRIENPTHWKEQVYTGSDFFEKMIAEKKGNVIVLSGNNQKKTEYILSSLQNGFHVLADKPMAINPAGFEQLKDAFATASKNKLLLYDIMTERYEITTVLQRELSMIPAVFGTLEKGTSENPAITKESVHHFYKFVSGSVLTRPAWFMDVSQQGEGIVDVMTHLVDLVQWQCFPDQTIDYIKDIKLLTAKRWSTEMTLPEFKAITKLDSFPPFLSSSKKEDNLQVFCNGEINYQLRGIHAKTSVIWRYKAPEGTADTHYSIMRGSKTNLVIRQGADEGYKPALYIEPVNAGKGYGQLLAEQLKSLQTNYPGISLKPSKNGWQVLIPEKYSEGHEAHFARVTEKFLAYLKNGNIPSWEVPNMLSKYYTTSKGLELALKSPH